MRSWDCVMQNRRLVTTITILAIVVTMGCGARGFQRKPPRDWVGARYEDLTRELGAPTIVFPREDALLTINRVPRKVKAGFEAVWVRGTYSWSAQTEVTSDHGSVGLYTDRFGARKKLVGGMCLIKFRIEAGIIIKVEDGCFISR